MFDSIGWGEVLVVAVAALFIFGPERLPSVAKDAARALTRLRATIRDVREQVGENLGDDLAELRNLDLARYNPKAVVRDYVFRDDQFDQPSVPDPSQSAQACWSPDRQTAHSPYTDRESWRRSGAD
jgi:sec-independent protein translocase protein TatB